MVRSLHDRDAIRIPFTNTPTCDMLSQPAFSTIQPFPLAIRNHDTSMEGVKGSINSSLGVGEVCESRYASKNKSDLTFSNTKLSAAQYVAIERQIEDAVLCWATTPSPSTAYQRSAFVYIAVLMLNESLMLGHDFWDCGGDFSPAYTKRFPVSGACEDSIPAARCPETAAGPSFSRSEAAFKHHKDLLALHPTRLRNDHASRDWHS